MVCPNCGRENIEGRKFCRFCARPLTGVAAPSQPAMPSALPSSPHAPLPSQASNRPPVTNTMAIASFGLSFLAFILPLGIASVVMGHISRRQIAKSAGRQRGTGLAFAGLILSYFQLAVVGLICLAVGVELFGLNGELDRHPDARAALAARFKYGDPYHPNATQINQHRQNAIDALRLIAARQGEYLAAHPDEGYACQVYLLESGASEGSELGAHLRDSRYEIKIAQCRGTRENENQYAVTAIPRSDFNPPDSPVYCLNQTGIIRKYSDKQTNDMNIAILFQHDTCPSQGEIIE